MNVFFYNKHELVLFYMYAFSLLDNEREHKRVHNFNERSTFQVLIVIQYIDGRS